MCATCGCGDLEHAHGHDEAHDHDHPHPHPHEHHHDPRPARTIRLEHDVLAKNEVIAARNRAWLSDRGIVGLNLMSSPGAGKTTLLEETIRRFAADVPLCAIEGDQETERDADRLRALGCPVVQINTGPVCHLDAAMIEKALPRLAPAPGGLLFIENVGNLVCPSMFRLGETERVALLSVTEGDDKPLKYPHIFRAATTAVISKIDLLPHVNFSLGACRERLRAVNPGLRTFVLSATSSEGMEAWCRWLVDLCGAHIKQRAVDS